MLPCTSEIPTTIRDFAYLLALRNRLRIAYDISRRSIFTRRSDAIAMRDSIARSGYSSCASLT